jgi:hypothetical protein
MWPYPNQISQGCSTVSVAVPQLATLDAFKQYCAELDAGCSSPLSDFDQYVQGLGCSCGETALTFADVCVGPYHLSSRTASTYAQVESYRLQIAVSGRVTITASTYIGVGYALTTLQQLLQPDGQGGCTISHLPVDINDVPRTYHRNVMLDTARTYFSTAAICRVLQQMGAHKMNHFDWHISDDQSFPLDVGPITHLFSVVPSTDPTFQGMTGAFDPSKSYSMDDVHNIIGTARNYGIVVEPGIDTPGHCSALMYGSKAASAQVLGESIQIVKNWELIWQGMTNAPEPVLGYLDVIDPAMRSKIVKVIHAIFREVYDAFQLQSGRYGRRFNINADEVGATIIPADTYTAYLNQLLSIFSTMTCTQDWTQVQISMWIDPVLALNVCDCCDDAYMYTDNLKLQQFDGRLTLGLWNLWPTVVVEQNNAVMAALPRSECINYNANYMYMDAGYPGQMWSGYNYDIDNCNCSELQTSFNLYWISALPTIGPQWGGYRGWPVAFGKIYTYNFHWDFTGTSPSSIVSQVAPGTGTAKLQGLAGAGVAVWTETITEGTLDAKLVSNLAAVAEMTWKYDPCHASDNLNHATYRLYHHLRQLEQAPYRVSSATPVYSGANIGRQFPQGCRMTVPVTENLHGIITQSYLDQHYPEWRIQIRPEYVGMVCNNLLVNINPEGPLGADAIAQCPLSARYVYGAMDPSTDPDVGANAPVTGRVNPWLMEDIGQLLQGCCSDRLGRSNFAAGSALHDQSCFYTDQRDAPIQLNAINND